MEDFHHDFWLFFFAHSLTFGLDRYIGLFQEQEIDLDTFLTMSDQDLRELGVHTFGPRRKMTMAIKIINESNDD